jgi:5-methylcytosine-specific restriction protein A
MAARPEWKRGWEALRLKALQRDRYLCQLCLPTRFTTAIEVDHIVNRALGGGNAMTNLQSLCAACHEQKSKREANPNYKERPEIGLDGWPIGQ